MKKCSTIEDRKNRKSNGRLKTLIQKLFMVKEKKITNFFLIFSIKIMLKFL